MLRIFFLVMRLLVFCAISSCSPTLLYYRDHTESQLSRNEASVIVVNSKDIYSHWILIDSIDGHKIPISNLVELTPGTHNMTVCFYRETGTTQMYPGVTTSETTTYKKEVSYQISVAAGHSYSLREKNRGYQKFEDYRDSPSEATMEDITDRLSDQNFKDEVDLLNKYWTTPHAAQYEILGF